MLTMLLLLLLLFVESIHEMTHIRECFNFFVSADILMGCARQKVMIRIATERRGDAASRFFPHTSGWISAIDRYMDTSMSYKHTNTCRYLWLYVP